MGARQQLLTLQRKNWLLRFIVIFPIIKKLICHSRYSPRATVFFEAIALKLLLLPQSTCNSVS